MLRGVICLFLSVFFFSTGSFASEYEDVHACDEYAAHPNDPHRWAKGVADEEIIPGPAVKFCREAVDDYEDTPRFQFQLARSLWAAHQYEEGLQIFLKLEEESEYGPAYAYLADAYMYGISGAEPNEELAISLYQIAEEEGFSPAAEVLASLAGEETISEGASETNVQAGQTANVEQEYAVEQTKPTQAAFDASIFVEQDVMTGFYDGDFSLVSKGKNEYLGSDNVLAYISGFLSQFSDTVNFRDQSCINLYDPALEKIVSINLARNVPGVGGLMFGGGGDLKSSLDAGAQQGFKILGDMFRGAQNGQGLYGGLVKAQQNIAVLKSSGETDGTRLILQYGCQSNVVRHVYANVAAYINGQNAMPSQRETKRRENARLEAERKAKIEARQQLKTIAEKSCVAQFKRDAYCGCLVEGLDENNITDQEWQRLGQSFKEVISIGKAYDGFADQMKACRGKT